ncbi:Werner Syndrome-like exonuclease [Dendronephthya gigantea]|uniref:Werner Syndrome-like exonuclease n=1 Tax=Dendronephthya gigantea TaxID=151771 RepID=UPI00106D9972|nr:Werner Syndrome-like exonuclease [Dendronephthya gigantea]
MAARGVEFLYKKTSKITDYLRLRIIAKAYARKFHYSRQASNGFLGDKENELSANSDNFYKENSSCLTLSEEELSEHPIRRFAGNIRVIKEPRNEQDLETLDVLNKLKREPVLGLDAEMTESKKGYYKRSKKTRVVQIASETDAVVWQLKNFTTLPPSLVFFLKSDILKVGHAISDDVVLLKKEFDVTSKRLLDTLPWAMQLNCKPLGLHAVCAIFLGWRISKGLRTSDWNRSELSENQIYYACTDAWASLLVYKEMKRVAVINGWSLPQLIESVTDILDTRLDSRKKRRQRLVQNSKARKNFEIMARTAQKIVE